jgi:hypothetical protein
MLAHATGPRGAPALRSRMRVGCAKPRVDRDVQERLADLPGGRSVGPRSAHAHAQLALPLAAADRRTTGEIFSREVLTSWGRCPIIAGGETWDVRPGFFRSRERGWNSRKSEVGARHSHVVCEAGGERDDRTTGSRLMVRPNPARSGYAGAAMQGSPLRASTDAPASHSFRRAAGVGERPPALRARRKTAH